MYAIQKLLDPDVYEFRYLSLKQNKDYYTRTVLYELVTGFSHDDWFDDDDDEPYFYFPQYRGKKFFSIKTTDQTMSELKWFHIHCRDNNAIVSPTELREYIIRRDNKRLTSGFITLATYDEQEKYWYDG